MPCPSEIRTERLLLRRWREDDFEPYARLSADPHVMRHFYQPPTREEGLQEGRRLAERFVRDGFGPWAVEVPGVAPFIGFAGCWRVVRDMPFGKPVEVGWRFDAAFWGQGYAPEAARAAMEDVFTRTDVDEIVAYTAWLNEPSRRVMAKLGMTHDPADDFLHPAVPADHSHAPTVLYRAKRSTFFAQVA